MKAFSRSINLFKMLILVTMLCLFAIAVTFPAKPAFAVNPPQETGCTLSTPLAAPAPSTQTTTITINFDEPIYIDGDATSDFNITVSGSSIMPTSVTRETSNYSKVDITLYGFYALTMDNLTIAPSSGTTLPDIKSVANDSVAVWNTTIQNKIIPTNLALERTYYNSSTGTAKFKVTHIADVRAMNWLQLSVNGTVAACTSEYNTYKNTNVNISALNWLHGSFFIHSHNYDTMVKSDYASEIADAINSSTINAAGIYGNFTASIDPNDSTGETVIITANSGSGELNLVPYLN